MNKHVSATRTISLEEALYKLNRYQPKTDKVSLKDFQTIRPFFIALMTDFISTTVDKEGRVSKNIFKSLVSQTSHYLHWAHNLNYKALRFNNIISLQLIESFVSTIPVSDSSKRRSRTDLRRLYRVLDEFYKHSSLVEWKPENEHENFIEPYTKQEVLDLIEDAQSQSTELRVRHYSLLIALTLGAGLSTRDIQELKNKDIEIHDDFIIIHLKKRDTVLHSEWNDFLLGFLEGKPSDYVFYPHRTNRENVVKNFTAMMPNIRPNVPRLKLTWLENLAQLGLGYSFLKEFGQPPTKFRNNPATDNYPWKIPLILARLPSAKSAQYPLSPD